MVPEGWKIETLADITRWSSGGTPSKSNPSFWGGHIPWISAASMRGHYYSDSESKITDLAVSKSAKIAEKGSILLLVRGSMLWNKIPVGITTCPVSFNQDVKCIVPHPNELNNVFFLYWLLANENRLMGMVTGTGIGAGKLDTSDLQNLDITLPPLPEQKKIAQILSTWDKAITTTEKLLANSEQQKKALMQQLLTRKRRFPGFAKAWVSYALNEIFEFKKGKGLSKDLLIATGKKKCILYGELYTKYSEIIKNVFSRTNSSDGFLSKVGDILIPCSTTTNGIDLANAVALLEDDVLLGGDINVLRPKIPIDSSLMAYLLTHIKKHAIASMAQGITIIHLYGSDLKGLQVFIPYALKEQQKITSALFIADSEIEALRKKIEFVKQEKKALMQQLLTGKRRVHAYE